MKISDICGDLTGKVSGGNITSSGNLQMDSLYGSPKEINGVLG